MLSLLEVLLTFAGVMLLLALVAERVQELVKAGLALKCGTRVAALRRLVMESARANQLLPTDGQQIFEQLVDRFRSLGQNGLRKRAVRLDAVDRDQLAKLIAMVDPAKVSGLSGEKGAESRLEAVGHQAEEWFDLAMEPVSSRYRRQMQGWSLATALLVVVVVNADALTILKLARDDPAFRQAVSTRVTELQKADSVAKTLSDAAATVGNDSSKADSLRARVAAQRDTAVGRRDKLMVAAATGSKTLLAGYSKDWAFSWQWLFGILFSAVLVSLGAPFWHDLLESVMGMKNRIRLQAAGGAPVEKGK